jgi:DNA-binding transcriptional MerR regulator
MEESFYTTNRAAEIVGCTIRQVQYWRKQRIVVPTIDASGTGHSVYYSRKDLTDLAIVYYLLQRGYSFQSAGAALAQLRDKDPNYNSPTNTNRYLLKWDTVAETIVLVELPYDNFAKDISEGLISVTALSLDLLHAEIEGTTTKQRGKSRSKKVDRGDGRNIDESDTCDEDVLTKLQQAGWGQNPYSIIEQRTFTETRSLPIGNKIERGNQKKADYILHYRQDLPIAVVEAKPNYKSPDSGLQRAKEHAEILGLKFAYSSNGLGIIEFDFTTGQEREIDRFPTPEELWAKLPVKG